MIQATRNRILVKLLPVTDDVSNTLNLVLVDKKKHYEHTSRKGKVASVGRGVRYIAVGDVVVFRGDAGFSMDGDPENQREIFGESHRWLKESDVLAVMETETSILAEAIA